MRYLDLPGKAIWDFHQGKCVEPLFVHDEFGPRTEMPIEIYFREEEDMPELERIAFEHCQGKILDIGAGAGAHALVLQQRGEVVSALEISPFSCATMRERGVHHVIEQDIFQYHLETKYDTLLLLMNGIGLCGSIERLRKFLQRAQFLISSNGQLLFDSCDIAYMYEENEKPSRYYGEARCKYSYGNVSTDWFQWLYIDRNTLSKIAKEEGWRCEILAEDENEQYLVSLRQK